MENFVQTRGARVNKAVEKNFVAVEYVARKKKIAAEKPSGSSTLNNSRKNEERDDEDASIDPRKQQEIAMKRARYEVIKLGMSGFDNVEASKAKVAAAIALGARPPKNRKVPYKKLKEDRSLAKEKILKKERVSGASKSLAKHRPKRTKTSGTKKRETGILGVYGKVERSSKGRKSSAQR